VAEARVSRSSFERNASLPDGATVATVRIGPATLDVPRFGFVPPAAAAEGDIEAMAMYAGESAGLIDAIVPAADIVAHTVRQADDLLRRAAAT
jgi:nitronate monooxygenase